MSVSVAICTYNRKTLALSCLESLFAQESELAGVTVVDNASNDGTREAIKARFGDRVNLVVNQENFGSSGGFSLAIEHACRESADYVLLLDSDSLLMPGALNRLVDYLNKHPEVWVVGPKILWPGKDRRVQTFGAYLDWPKTELAQAFCNFQEGSSAHIVGDIEVDCVLACCALIRKDAFAKAGNIDPKYFIYMDDVDWCWRVQQAGGRLVTTSSAEVIHHCSDRAVKKSHFPTFYCWRNEAYFFSRFCPEVHREAVHQRLLIKACRAVATSRVLGMERAARVIEIAVTEGISGNLGKRDFTDLPLEIDIPSKYLSDPHEARDPLCVDSIFEVSSESLEGHTWVMDSFGKTIRVSVLESLLESYRRCYDDLAAHFSVYWERALCRG